VRSSFWAATVLLLANVASATPPPIPFCVLNRRLCHPLVGARYAHYHGLLNQLLRAVPKIPGYRCTVARREINDVGYGRSARSATPHWIIGDVWCFKKGTDSRTKGADLTIDIDPSVVPATHGEGGTRDDQHDLLVFAAPNTVSLVFGKIREYRDLHGVIHRGAGLRGGSEEELVNDGPYLISTEVRIFSEDPAALDAFARGFDRAVISTILAREARRRKADPESKPIWEVLPESNAH
jgi:hypothetical protein